ncbi:MAG: hypothetical protein QM767_04565 [Anaeromyxobacter sp.]
METDLRGAPAWERTFLGHLWDAALEVERLHALQRGVAGLERRIPEEDTPSRLAFVIEKGPWCTAPAVRGDAACSAVTPAVPRSTAVTPAGLACSALDAGPDATALGAPFTAVVRRPDGGLAAIPFPQAWPEASAATARDLRLAAAALPADEAGLRAYLEAAATAFETNDWYAADEAWARAAGSRFYLRVAPDEVYWEPCALKAGYGLTLARTDAASKAWQARLEPVKNDLERELARLAGPPYQARAVAFALPEFIDVILNAGDARHPRGAVIGQSLPNFGPVANEGRGRTVAMVNLYDDAASRARARARAASVLCPATMKAHGDDRDTAVLGTLLHEAAHNLGPSAEYAVGGKTAPQLFGGPVASMLEELKAQTSALHLTGWLAARGVIDPGLAARSRLSDLAWAFGQSSLGVRDQDGELSAYPALATVQLGFLLSERALVWRGDARAADGVERGCMEVDAKRWPAAVEKLEAAVLRIQGARRRGRREGAGGALAGAARGAHRRHHRALPARPADHVPVRDPVLITPPIRLEPA